MTRATVRIAALGALLASAAAAQGPAPSAFTVISPIFGQPITFSLPANFVTVRGPTAAQSAIDEGKWLARLGQLQPIRLCPIVPGEPAPYPSCVSKN
ncbi:MAG: hypothetical protein ACREEK_16835 [Bradyrhizobium sp.]